MLLTTLLMMLQEAEVLNGRIAMVAFATLVSHRIILDMRLI